MTDELARAEGTILMLSELLAQEKKNSENWHKSCLQNEERLAELTERCVQQAAEHTQQLENLQSILAERETRVTSLEHRLKLATAKFRRTKTEKNDNPENTSSPES